MSVYRFRKAAVLGAGVMGAQIAAHLANAGVPVALFDLAADGADKNAIVDKSVAGLGKLSPAPLASKALAQSIERCNYDEHLDRLADCDLVIEAIAERLDWRFWLPTPPACRSMPCPRCWTNPCITASAACISSIRRATCT